MYSNIVVGTDGSPTAKTALQHAIDLAASGGATIHIVSAYRAKGVPITVGTDAESWTVDDHTRVDAVLQAAAATARAGSRSRRGRSTRSRPRRWPRRSTPTTTPIGGAKASAAPAHKR